MEQKVYRPPEPEKKSISLRVDIDWKKIIGSLLIVATLVVFGYLTYPWLKFYAQKYILKRQETSIVETQQTKLVGKSQTKNQTIYFKVETADIEIVAPIVDGVSEQDLKQGIGHHPTTPWPDDKRGNVILAGHSSDIDPSNKFGQVFRYLGRIKISDKVSIVYPDSEYIYNVIGKYEIDPADTTLFGQDAGPRLTFYTCSPVFTNWRRLVYVASLEQIKTDKR